MKRTDRENLTGGRREAPPSAISRSVIVAGALLCAAVIALVGSGGPGPAARAPASRPLDAPDAAPTPVAWPRAEETDAEAPRREHVVRAIASLGDREIDALKRELLTAPDPADRARVLRILARTADPRHSADVRALLGRETHPEVRRAAIRALGRFGDVASADALAILASEPAPERRAASLALLDLRDADALRAALAHWLLLPADARGALLHAATGAGAPFLHAASEALFDPDEQVRQEALRLLAGLGDIAVDPLLDHALRGATEADTLGAVRALRDVGTPKAAEAGLRAVETLPPRPQARYRAMFLETLAG